MQEINNKRIRGKKVRERCPGGLGKVSYTKAHACIIITSKNHMRAIKEGKWKWNPTRIVSMHINR